MLYDIYGREIVAKVISNLRGKKLSILGDSICTYKDWIPEGNANYYTGNNAGVTSVDQTFWKRIIDSCGMTLEVNQSWSGSYVTTTNGEESAACMARATDLGTNPDIIFVHIGGNDFISGVDMGTYDGSQAFPSSTLTIREAYAVMLKKMMDAYPTAKVYLLTLVTHERNGAVGVPEINPNGVQLKEFNAMIYDMADIFGCDVIDMSKCGITYSNLDVYMGDYVASTGKGLHPNEAGHALMAKKAISTLDAGIRID